ncbi:MAG: ATP-binding protein [Candidatus Hodarchaeota archaeon]
MANTRKFEQDDLWVLIDLDLCAAAGECVDVCPEGVYDIIDGKVTAENIGLCTECGACEDVCPHAAILEHCGW